MTPYYDHAGITIYHGDALKIARDLSGSCAIISDPPYGMAYDTDGSRFTRGGRSLPPVHGDDAPFDAMPWARYRWCVLWGFNHFPRDLPSGGALVWIKRSDLAFGSFLSDAELAWTKNGHGVYVYSDTKHPISGEHLHPTQKPVGLMVWSIERSGVPMHATILDPFMGSGTTLVAARECGRRAIGIEIEERYCAIAVERLRQEVLPFAQSDLPFVGEIPPLLTP